MAKKNKDVLAEEVKAITSKWKTTGDIRETLSEQMQLVGKDTYCPELASALNREVAKATKKINEQTKEMKKAIAEREVRISRPE